MEPWKGTNMLEYVCKFATPFCGLNYKDYHNIRKLKKPADYEEGLSENRAEYITALPPTDGIK